MDYRLITDVEVDNINPADAPDFVDAYIVYAEYDGEEMTQDQLDELNEDLDFVYNCVLNYFY